jgi:two-component system LytT family sensor kinase
MTINRKYTPYIFIAVLTIFGAILGYIIVSTLPWYVYLLGTFIRFGVVCAIWQLIRLVNKRLARRFTIEQRPGTQILLQVLVTMLLMSPVIILSYLSFLTFKPYVPDLLQYGRMFPLIFAIYFMLLMMMTFGYYTYDLFSKHKDSLEQKSKFELAAAQLEKEKSMMRYHHLKNQINPHFLFNTLTSLDGLIQSNPDLASEFIRHLSKVYRYVLEHKENEVVSLETEITFIEHYISLLRIRYHNAIDIKLNISEAAKERGIVMITLQMLIDNAVKHNSIQTEMPLRVDIWDEGSLLHICNNKQLRKQIETSNKKGLKQLSELYAFLTAQPVEITDKASHFEINLPLL